MLRFILGNVGDPLNQDLRPETRVAGKHQEEGKPQVLVRNSLIIISRNRRNHHHNINSNNVDSRIINIIDSNNNSRSVRIFSQASSALCLPSHWRL